jgi:hypothetical protein
VTDRNAPLRLKVAAELAFPFGGMTASGLRREIARGNLPVEVIAGKQFVTLAGIDEMRDRCRTNPKERASSLRPPRPTAKLSGSSEMEKNGPALDAALKIAEELSSGSEITLRKNTNRVAPNSIHPQSQPLTSSLYTRLIEGRPSRALGL